MSPFIDSVNFVLVRILWWVAAAVAAVMVAVATEMKNRRSVRSYVLVRMRNIGVGGQRTRTGPLMLALVEGISWG